VFAGLLAVASAGGVWCAVSSDSTGAKLVAVGAGCTSVWISDDFGATWKKTAAPSQPYGGLYSDPTGMKLVAGEAYNSATVTKHGLMVSSDRGVTWTSAMYNNEASTTFYDESTVKISGSGSKLLTVQGSRKLMKSSDSGLTWYGVDNIPYKNTYGYNGYASAMSGSGSVWYALNDVQEVYVSKNTGSTWTKANTNATYEWKNFVTDSTGSILYANTQLSFHVSFDYGTTLTSIHTWPGSYSFVTDITTDPNGKYCYVLASDGLWVYTKSTGTFVKNPTLTVTYNQGYTALSVDVSDNGQHIVVSSQDKGMLSISDDFGSTWKYVAGL